MFLEETTRGNIFLANEPLNCAADLILELSPQGAREQQKQKKTLSK